MTHELRASPFSLTCPHRLDAASTPFHDRCRIAPATDLVVELPCGLALGSHITVASTPLKVHLPPM